MWLSICLFGWVMMAESSGSTEQSHNKITRSVTAAIKKCEFIELGTRGFKVFVGITLADKNAPYIRFNIPFYERTNYESWCDQKTQVEITYRIKRTKDNLTTTYWGESISVVDESGVDSS